MNSENVSHENKELLHRLSKLSCAMITQAVKDFMRSEDIGNNDFSADNMRKIKTKNASISKYKESAERWLLGEDEGAFSLKTCCVLINTKLAFSGYISDASEGVSVKLFARLVHLYNSDENSDEVFQQLDKLTKITYLSERDQQPSDDVTIYSINMPSDFVEHSDIHYRGGQEELITDDAEA